MSARAFDGMSGVKRILKELRDVSEMTDTASFGLAKISDVTCVEVRLRMEWRARVDGAALLLSPAVFGLSLTSLAAIPCLPQDNIHVWRFRVHSFDNDVPGGRKLNEDLNGLADAYGHGYILMEARFPMVSLPSCSQHASRMACTPEWRAAPNGAQPPLLPAPT